MRFHLGIAWKARRLFISTPSKKQGLNGENPDEGLDLKIKQEVSGLGFKSPEFGSNRETFFDSRAWLDSDCDDDFYSVNGDFTPSRGSTPNHQTDVSRLNKAWSLDKFSDLKSEPSPTGRKRLSDLLQETSQGEQLDNKEDAIDIKEVQGKHDLLSIKPDSSATSLNGTPNMSGSSSVYSSELTPNRDANKKKEKARKRMNCCLPRLVHNSSINERRQKMSPVRAASEKS